MERGFQNAPVEELPPGLVKESQPSRGRISGQLRMHVISCDHLSARWVGKCAVLARAVQASARATISEGLQRPI